MGTTHVRAPLTLVQKPRCRVSSGFVTWALLVPWWLGHGVHNRAGDALGAEGGVVYRTFKEVASDIRLVWYNALRYNPAGNPVHRLAEDFQRKFEEEYKRVEEEYVVWCGCGWLAVVSRRLPRPVLTDFVCRLSWVGDGMARAGLSKRCGRSSAWAPLTARAHCASAAAKCDSKRPPSTATTHCVVSVSSATRCITPMRTSASRWDRQGCSEALDPGLACHCASLRDVTSLFCCPGLPFAVVRVVLQGPDRPCRG